MSVTPHSGRLSNLQWKPTHEGSGPSLLSFLGQVRWRGTCFSTWTRAVVGLSWGRPTPWPRARTAQPAFAQLPHGWVTGTLLSSCQGLDLVFPAAKGRVSMSVPAPRVICWWPVMCDSLSASFKPNCLLRRCAGKQIKWCHLKQI